MATNVRKQTNPELATAVHRLVKMFEPDRVYLYGSRARGDSNQDSDYDIMVVVPESDLPAHQRAQQTYSVLWETDIPVEVLVFTREQFERQATVVASLAATVKCEGVVLYER